MEVKKKPIGVVKMVPLGINNKVSRVNLLRINILIRLSKALVLSDFTI